jgi:hypothetical protein
MMMQPEVDGDPEGSQVGRQTPQLVAQVRRRLGPAPLPSQVSVGLGANLFLERISGPAPSKRTATPKERQEGGADNGRLQRQVVRLGAVGLVCGHERAGLQPERRLRCGGQYGEVSHPR